MKFKFPFFIFNFETIFLLLHRSLSSRLIEELSVGIIALVMLAGATFFHEKLLISSFFVAIQLRVLWYLQNKSIGGE